MLILTRRFNESIIIGDGLDAIEVEVVQLGGDKVRLGIEAPKKTPVHRKEVYHAILAERAAKNGQQ